MSTIRSVCPVLGAYVAVQIGIVLFLANDGFIDENLYTAAGLRVLRGFGMSDGYFSWFNGSPLLWPPLAGLGYEMGGLAGARFVAVALSTVTLWFVAAAAGALFGETVALWSAIALALNGYFVKLGHFAVYDALGLTASSLAFWLIVHHARTARRSSLWLAAFAACVSTLAKHAFVGMLLPLVGVLIAYGRPRWRWADAFTFLALTALGILCYRLMFRAQLAGFTGSGFFSQAGVYGRPKLLCTGLYAITVPAVLGAIGARFAWRSGRRALALALLWPLFIWPAYHVLAVNHVSLSKHVVFGMVFTAPLVGVAMDRLWQTRQRWMALGVTAALAALAGVQWYLLENAWERMQPATEYLRARYQPEDHLVVTLNSWAFGLDFYTHALVDNPRFPANQWQLAQNGDVNAVCRNKWLVEDGWAQGVSALLDEAIHKCPYRTAFRYPAPTYEVGDDGRWGYIPHDVVVYVRSDTASAPDR